LVIQRSLSSSLRRLSYTARALVEERTAPGSSAPRQPIQELLHRIKWDAEFGKGEFALGFYDRVVHEEIIVPFVSISLDPQRSDTFSFHDEDGIVHHIPLHRVQSVYKDGVVIWRRPGRPALDGAHDGKNP
jgi:uncharacterized protein (UPF0248 family)